MRRVYRPLVGIPVDEGPTMSVHFSRYLGEQELESEVRRVRTFVRVVWNSIKTINTVQSGGDGRRGKNRVVKSSK